MWGITLLIVPVVVGALGIGRQGQADIVESLPGNRLFSRRFRRQCF